jgi:hypothetical protein
MLYRNSLLTKNDGSRPAYPDNRRACAHHDAPLSMRAEQILRLVAGRDLQVLHDSGEMEFVARAGSRAPCRRCLIAGPTSNRT